MSFDPLPGIFTELFDGRDDAKNMRAVELGCGDGRFTALLRQIGLPCTGLDKWPRDAGVVADIVGDALRPPLARHSLDLVIAANLVRHLIPARPEFDFLPTWVELLRPGGSVFIFEDEPTGNRAACRNYRDLHLFLAELQPGVRGPLVSLEKFLAAIPVGLAADVAGSGVGANLWSLDAGVAAAMLRGGGGSPGGAPQRLAAAIDRDGLACGRMWWCRLRAASGN